VEDIPVVEPLDILVVEEPPEDNLVGVQHLVDSLEEELLEDIPEEEQLRTGADNTPAEGTQEPGQDIRAELEGSGIRHMGYSHLALGYMVGMAWACLQQVPQGMGVGLELQHRGWGQQLPDRGEQSYQERKRWEEEGVPGDRSCGRGGLGHDGREQQVEDPGTCWTARRKGLSTVLLFLSSWQNRNLTPCSGK